MNKNDKYQDNSGLQCVLDLSWISPCQGMCKGRIWEQGTTPSDSWHRSGSCPNASSTLALVPLLLKIQGVEAKMKQCETKYKRHQIVIKCLGWIVLSCYISFPHWPLSILETSPKAQLVLKLRECLSLQGMDNNTSDFIWRNSENKQNRSQQIGIAPVLTTSHDLMEKSFEVPGHGTSFLARDCIAVSKCERSVPPGHNSF